MIRYKRSYFWIWLFTFLNFLRTIRRSASKIPIVFVLSDCRFLLFKAVAIAAINPFYWFFTKYCMSTSDRWQLLAKNAVAKCPRFLVMIDHGTTKSARITACCSGPKFSWRPRSGRRSHCRYFRNRLPLVWKCVASITFQKMQFILSLRARCLIRTLSSSTLVSPC